MWCISLHQLSRCLWGNKRVSRILWLAAGQWTGMGHWSCVFSCWIELLREAIHTDLLSHVYQGQISVIWTFVEPLMNPGTKSSSTREEVPEETPLQFWLCLDEVKHLKFNLRFNGKWEIEPQALLEKCRFNVTMQTWRWIITGLSFLLKTCPACTSQNESYHYWIYLFRSLNVIVSIFAAVSASV